MVCADGEQGIPTEVRNSLALVDVISACRSFPVFLTEARAIEAITCQCVVEDTVTGLRAVEAVVELFLTCCTGRQLID